MGTIGCFLLQVLPRYQSVPYRVVRGIRDLINCLSRNLLKNSKYRCVGIKTPPLAKKCFFKNCQKISKNKSFGQKCGWEFQKIRDWILKSGAFCAAGEKIWTCFAWFWTCIQGKISQKAEWGFLRRRRNFFEDISERIRGWEKNLGKISKNKKISPIFWEKWA